MEFAHLEFFFRLSIQVVGYQDDVPAHCIRMYENRIAVRFRLIEKRQQIGEEEVDWEEVPEFRKKWYQNRILFPTPEFLTEFERCLLDAGLLPQETGSFLNRLTNPVYLNRYRKAARIVLIFKRRALFQLYDYNSRLIPATEESIQALDEFKVSEEFEVSEDCAICLARPCLGVSLSRMPCSHIFHSDCIGMWLRKNHICPMCRFGMPIHNPESSIASLPPPPPPQESDVLPSVNSPNHC